MLEVQQYCSEIATLNRGAICELLIQLSLAKQQLAVWCWLRRSCMCVPANLLKNDS